MIARIVIVSLALVATLTAGQEVKKHNLPVLFQYEEPGHSVAVFRGAELKQAIAAGLVPGFGNLGRQGKKIDTSADDMAAAKAAAEAKAAADARTRAAAAKAAADARAAEEARQARAR